MLKLPGNDGIKMTTIKQQDLAYVWNLKMKQTKENKKKTELIETENRSVAARSTMWGEVKIEILYF